MSENADIRDEIRDNVALEALEVCQVYGAEICYQDRAADTPIKLWCIPGPEKRRLGKGGSIQEEETQRDFTIPRQPCFPPANEPSVEAQIVYEGHTWNLVDEGGEAWKRDSVGACFTCTAARHQPRRSNG